MSTAPAVEYSSQASEDFWAWMGPKVDAWDAEADLIASMPERDEDEAMCLYGEDVEFDIPTADIVQVPTSIEAELAIW